MVDFFGFRTHKTKKDIQTSWEVGKCDKSPMSLELIASADNSFSLLWIHSDYVTLSLSYWMFICHGCLLLFDFSIDKAHHDNYVLCKQRGFRIGTIVATACALCITTYWNIMIYSVSCVIRDVRYLSIYHVYYMPYSIPGAWTNFKASSLE